MQLLSERSLTRLNRAVVTGRIVPYLAFVTFMITVGAGLVVWVLSPHSFNGLGDAMWWSAQTVTTVGYGDVIPATGPGRIVAVFVMIFGVAAVSFMTAVVTAAFVAYQERRLGGTEDKHQELLQTLARIEQRIESLETRR